MKQAKQPTVSAASHALQRFWPEFVERNGCFFVRFQCGDGTANEGTGDKTETECFINHTHVLDEFRNSATSRSRESVSEELDVVDEAYDVTHPDFIRACDIGRTMARLWAIKLKSDYPFERFRVYYTQYDNPIVRFHKVRLDERVWLTDEELKCAAERSFANAVIYDTDYLDEPVMRGDVRPN